MKTTDAFFLTDGICTIKHHIVSYCIADFIRLIFGFFLLYSIVSVKLAIAAVEQHLYMVRNNCASFPMLSGRLFTFSDQLVTSL